jgi:hypothetical protein
VRPRQADPLRISLQRTYFVVAATTELAPAGVVAETVGGGVENGEAEAT